MKGKLPNIILIMTDQQRYDTIRALGAQRMITPNLDRLAQEGVSFDNVFVTAPSCVPSRASFFNGRYPLSMGVGGNASTWGTSWIERLRSAGYHTVNIGKMHTVPLDTPHACGFDRRLIVENKDRPLKGSKTGTFFDEWDKFLALSGVEKPSRQKYKAEYPSYDTALGAFEWPLEEKDHADAFVGRMAQWYVERNESDGPLFLQIGFPGPHPPYDPPQRWIDAYRERDFPVPTATREELSRQPPAHHVARQVMIHDHFDAVKWQEQPTPEQLRRLRRYYAANISLIDEQIGLIMEALEKRGYLEDAIVLFTSDHGDSMGDHGHIQKWNMYDCVTHVPMLVRAPGRLPSGMRAGALLQHMDIAATLFELIGLEAPPDWDAVSALPNLDGGREVVFAEHGPDNVYKHIQRVTMARTRDYKLVEYDGEPHGELYDLNADPGEVANLWDEPRYAQLQRDMSGMIAGWRTERNQS